MTMNLNHESLLSAYLDEELDEPQRLSVAAALKADPRLASELAKLMRVRDLVAGLHRPPTSFDLAGPVLAELRANRIGGRRQLVGFPLPRPYLYILGAGLSSAAALLLALTLWVNLRVSRQPHPPVQPTVASPASPAGGESNPLQPSASAESSTVAHNEDLDAPASAALVAGPTAEERRIDRERESILRKLYGTPDEPSVRRVFVTTDQIDVVANEVDHLLQNTPRRVPPYGCITVEQGIVIDPRYPNRAKVFIVVIDDKELNYLRGKLVKDLHLALLKSETVTPPEATLLAGIGQVDVFPGQRETVPLTDPPTDASARVALKTPDSTSDKRLLVGPSLAQGSAAPADSRRSGPDSAAATDTAPANVPKAAESGRNQTISMRKADSLSTVLVWVTSGTPVKQ
jgi:hypothetical protein